MVLIERYADGSEIRETPYRPREKKRYFMVYMIVFAKLKCVISCGYFIEKEGSRDRALKKAKKYISDNKDLISFLS